MKKTLIIISLVLTLSFLTPGYMAIAGPVKERSNQQIFDNTTNEISTMNHYLEDTTDCSDDILSYSYISPHTLPLSIPNDPLFDRQWSLHNTGQKQGMEDIDIDALEAWEIETGGSEVTIAIIDSGIDFGHPDLIGNIWINSNEISDNGIDDDLNGFIDDINGYDFTNTDGDTIPFDRNGHGTLLAGRIAPVSNNNIGISGITWDCKIMPLQVIGDSSWQADIKDIIDALHYAADNGAKIIIMTFEGRQYNQDFQDAINYAYQQGAFICCAAGNEGTSFKRYPGAYENVTTVASLDYNNQRMIYTYEDVGINIASNYGDWVDIAAPGVEIYSTMPTYHVPLNDVYALDETYTIATGCCVTVPLVAGVAALVLSKNPDLTPDELYEVVCGSVDPYDSDKYIGTGRVNAFKSVTAPEKPEKPIGPVSGRTDSYYTFSTKTQDNEGDKVFFMWDWGNGNYSEWLGPYDSGEICETQYKWGQQDEYMVKVRSKDINDGYSPWSDPLSVSLPRGKMVHPLSYYLSKLFYLFNE